MAAHRSKGENALNTALVKKHLETGSKMETQRQIYAGLKKEFFRSLTNYM